MMQPQGTSLLYFSSSLCAQPVEADVELIKSTSLAVRASPMRCGFVDSSFFFCRIPIGWVHKPSRLIKRRFN